MNGNYPFLHYVAEKAQCAKSTQAIERIRSAHTSMYSQWKVGMHPDLQQSISDFFVGFKKDFAAKNGEKAVGKDRLKFDNYRTLNSYLRTHPEKVSSQG